MIILVILAVLLLLLFAYLRGEKNGDAAGYERGTFDGRQKARNEAAFAAEVARRQREIAERVQKMEIPKVIEDIPAVAEAIAAKPASAAVAAATHGHHRPKSRRR